MNVCDCDLPYAPSEHKHDGEQRHQLHQVLADVGGHDGQLQEEEEEEAQRLGDVVGVHPDVPVHLRVQVERPDGAEPDPGHAQHQHACTDTEEGQDTVEFIQNQPQINCLHEI